MRRNLVLLFCVAALLMPLTGCFTLNHTVGSGASSTATTVGSKRQWYLLFGLVPMGKVDGGKIAKEKGLTNYTVKSKRTIVDLFLNCFTSILTLNSQSVKVIGDVGAASPSAVAQPASSSSDSLAKGNVAMGQKDYVSALQQYQAAVSADPNNAGAYQALGTCYYYLGQKAEAVSAFEKSLALNPANTQLANFLNALKK